METHEDFLARIRQSIKSGMELGVDQGWWPSYDDHGPHPWPMFYILSENIVRRPTVEKDFWGCPVYSSEPFECQYMSQLLAYLGIFSSVNQARKAGYGRPIEVQELWFNKRSTHLYIDED